MRDLMRPSRRRSRHQPAPRRFAKKKRGGFFRTLFKWSFRLLLFICLVSALPMVALRYYDPPTSNFIELNKRNNNSNIKHQWVPIEDVSLYFSNAVIASEDQQFPNHFGFDIKQIKLVLEERKHGQSRGASTISQQTVKNLFLWPGRSFVRKGIEAWLVVWMELIVPKKRILEIYVNYAQFGKSVFGVGAVSIDRSEPTNTLKIKPGKTKQVLKRASSVYYRSNAPSGWSAHGTRIVTNTGLGQAIRTRIYSQ